MFSSDGKMLHQILFFFILRLCLVLLFETMAYLVIVHVPYTVQTVSDNEQENTEGYVKDTKDDLDSNRADGSKSDLKKLNGDENIEVNKIGRESSTEQADGTSLTDDTEDITKGQTNIHKEETVDPTNVTGKNEADDQTQNGDKTEEFDKSEAGEGSEISNKSEEGDESETGNKSETGDEFDIGNKTETGNESETGNKSEMDDESETGNKTTTGDESESSTDIRDKQGENEENTDEDSLDIEAPLTPLFQKIPIHERVKTELIRIGVDNVDMNIVGNGLYMKFSFVQDDSQQCEQILNRLRGIGVGLTAGSSMSVFPSSLHESAKPEMESKASLLGDDSPEKTDKNEEVDQKKSQFKKSVKSRLLVAQVVKSVTANALFTFDYLLLLILASIIACIGLAENSSVVLVASMLISPLMGPILAATFGQVIKKKDLRNLGLKSEIKGLALCLIVGFVFGLVSGGVNLNGAVWGSSDSWPTIEMKSRGMLRSLWVGVLIALPSGAGVAISVLGGNAGSLVGVAISASLLPPACNAGMLWAYSLLAAISPPEVVGSLTTRDFVITTPSPITLTSVNISLAPNTTITTDVTSSTPAIPATTLGQTTGHCQPLINNKYTEVYFCNVAHEAALLGLVSLFLTLINICCIIVMGIVVLKIKEVAPKSAGVDTFWREDVQVARGYYSTAKGQTSKSLGKTFLEEYRKLQAQTKDLKKKKEDKTEEPVKEDEISEEESLDNDMAAIEVHDFLQDVENSPDCQEVFSKLPNFTLKKFAEDLNTEYEEAALNISNRLSKKPGIYLTDNSIRDKDYQRVYNTIHGPSTQRAGIVELRNAFKRRKAPSMFIESSALNHNDADLDKPRQSKSSLGLSDPRSKLFSRRKRQVKFQVTKVEEELELV